MSARVLNPAMMTEISRNLGGGGGGGGGGRVAPSSADLARVRRDLFGPVDHTAARELAERELHTQSVLDSERWGFDFRQEIPRENSRYEWQMITEQDIVPEPYALRGMPYLRKHAPSTPRKLRVDDTLSTIATTIVAEPSLTTSMAISQTTTMMTTTTTTTVNTRIIEKTETSATPTAERTPPQEPRVPEIGDATTPNQLLGASVKRNRCTIEPTTPVLPPAARKQPTITDFMKSRKRGLNGTAKSMIEPPEKIARNAGQIRS